MLRTVVRCGLTLLLVSIALGRPASGAAESTQVRICKATTAGQKIAMTVSVVPAGSAAAAPPSLAASAFSVREGEARRRITVRRLRAEKLQVAVVVGTARSAADLDAVRTAISALVLRLPVGSRTAVIAASTKPTVLAKMTSTGATTTAAAGNLRPTAGQSAIDGVDLALDQFSSERDFRRVIVLITSSFSGSVDDVGGLSDRLVRNDISIYPVNIDQSSAPALSSIFLLPLGCGQAPLVVGGLLPIVNFIADELASQYRIGFTTAGKSDTTLITLKVRTGAESIILNKTVDIPDSLAPSDQGGTPVALTLAALALVVAAVILGLFLPPRWAARRAARRPMRPLLVETAQSFGGGASICGPLVANGFPPPPARPGEETTLATAAGVRVALGGDLVEGVDAVRELLRTRTRQVRSVWLADDAPDVAIQRLADDAHVPVRRASPAEIESASQSGLADGVLAHAAPLVPIDLDELVESSGRAQTILLVDRLDDGASLGALMRTGVSCGVTGVVLPRRRSSPISPTTVAVARGAVEHVRLVLVSNLATAAARLRAGGFLVVGIDAAAPVRLLDLDIDLSRQPVVLVIDGQGRLDSLLAARCDVRARVDLPPGSTATGDQVGQRACVELARRRIPGGVH